MKLYKCVFDKPTETITHSLYIVYERNFKMFEDPELFIMTCLYRFIRVSYGQNL